MSEFKGIFKQRYQLKGRDWVKLLEPEDYEAFIRMGLAATEYGRKGGRIRAEKGKRDKRGRFTKNDNENS